MSVQTMKRRIDALGGVTDDEDCESFWLVREKRCLPEEATNPNFVFHKPMLSVPYRRMKVSEFRSIMKAVDGKTRTARPMP